MAEVFRIAMMETFKKKIAPTNFLSSMFQSPDVNKSDTRFIDVHVKRNGEEMAVDVLRESGGRGNINKRFTRKRYEPPFYNEWANTNASERLLQIFGKTEYDAETIADVIAAITDDQALMQDKIIRAIEKQAADAFITGTVPLINYDTIDFKQKTSHKITPPTAWSNSAGVPIDDLADGAKLIRIDGQTTTTDAIFGEDAFKLFFNNNQVKAKADFRRVDQINVRPPVMNSEGANFHGTVSIDEYVINIWTYPQYYIVQTGYGLPNEGESVPYIPADKVWLGNFNTRHDLYYAGVEKLVTMSDPRLSEIGFTAFPQTMRGDFHPYAIVDTLGQNTIYGVKSAPLCVPTDIDSFCVFTAS